MNPRKLLILWQEFAHRRPATKWAFAPTQAPLQGRVIGKIGPAGLALHCYPFPLTWPSPPRVGPIFFAGNGASAASAKQRRSGALDALFTFLVGETELSSAAIKTPNRGSQSCKKPSLFSFLSQRRLPAVCKTLQRAALPALSLALPLLMAKTATCWAARLSAGLQGSLLVRSPANWAAATQVSDNRTLTASAAGFVLHPAIQGALPFGWLFSFAWPTQT
jgi:hypothetical protein